MTKSAVSFRTTWLFLAGAAGVLVALSLYVFFGEEKPANPEGVLLESFHASKTRAADITGLEIEKGGAKMIFARQPDGRWRMTQPVAARADSERIESIIQQVLNAPRIDKGTGVTGNPAAHGLSPPAVTITLQKDDRTAWLALGTTTAGDEEAIVYVLSSDAPNRPQAMRLKRLRSLLKENPADEAKTADMIAGVDELRSRKLAGEGIALEAAPGELKSITLETAVKGAHPVKLANENGVWRFQMPPGYGDVVLDVPEKNKNPNTVFNLTSLLTDILTIEVPSTQDFLPAAQDLSKLGLDPASPNVLRIDLDWGEPIGKETLWISNDYAKSKEKTTDMVYARNSTDPGVAMVGGQKPRMLRQFLENPGALRDRTLVRLRADAVDAVDITTDGGSFELRKLNGKWLVGGGGQTPLEANKAAVNELLFRLSEPRQILRFPSENLTDDQLGFTHPKVDIKLWQNGLAASGKSAAESWPKVEGPPAARIQFGNSDGDTVYARRYAGLNKLDAQMSSQLLERVSRGRLDYVDIALKSFNPVNIEKLRFTRAAEEWQIDRDKGQFTDPSGWKIVAPASAQGKRVDVDRLQMIIESFKALAPEKVDYADPKPDLLNVLGLSPDKAQLKLSIKLKDAPDERTYLFGNKVNARPGNVYTKTNFCNFVFESAESRVELVTKSRLLEPILYRLEITKVKGLKLRGWIDPAHAGEPLALNLERKAGGNWSSADGIKLNNARVEEFMTDLLQPRWVDQIAAIDETKSAYGLGIKQGALEIVIEVENGKPITLTLGAPAGKDGKESKLIYAATNQSPGQVFTVDGERFRSVKEKRDSLLDLPNKK